MNRSEPQASTCGIFPNLSLYLRAFRSYVEAAVSPSVGTLGASLQIVQLHGLVCLRVSWGVAPSALLVTRKQRTLSPVQFMNMHSSLLHRILMKEIQV